MDKSRVQELERQVVNQKEQLARYEKRIHDVVTAYKGLLKEKECLEASLSAVTTSKKEGASPTKVPESPNDGPSIVPEEMVDSGRATQDQIATVMNSLATLSAEKSRMEMSFQRDKKQLRQEMQDKDQRIRELEDKVKLNVNRNNLELEGLKSKLIVERHAREKETNDQLIMIKELQKLLSDERQLKENLEMQLNDLKVAFSGLGSQSKNKDLQSEIEKLKQDQLEFQLERDRQSSGAAAVTQEQLQEQKQLIANMKVQHVAALKYEQARTMKAEEQIRSMSLVHEERVGNLEARLSELSTIVGNYDRLRQQDKEAIQMLKLKLLDATSSTNISSKPDIEPSVEGILVEIQRLKEILMEENSNMKHPVDVSHIFSLKNDHGNCMHEQTTLRNELLDCQVNYQGVLEEVATQKSHIKNLQEKITVLNKNIEDQEIELKESSDRHLKTLKEEREKWKQVMSTLEAETRSKTEEMEQHLQKQRERSLNLLEEKDNEIKALKTSFDLFIPVESNADSVPTSPTSITAPSAPFSSKVDGSSKTNEFHILHYVHELARKDVEISSLRKSKHSAESAMRQAIKDKINSQEELHDQLAVLEEQVGRLERCQSREGANLEYLKNIILNFLLTKDTDSKRHMINAIGAVLKFSPSELKMISNYFYNKK